MALKPTRTPRREKIPSKSVSSMIREAIVRNGFRDVKHCARSIQVPYDLFNKVVGGHIPKDSQLIEYAKKLKIDSHELILTAYREKVPDDMKGYFNSARLLDNPNGAVKEIIQIVDDCNSDQLQELLQVARTIRSAGRENCRKAIRLLQLYQQMDPELMALFESLVLLALRNDKLSGLKEFKSAIGNSRPAARRGLG